MGMATFLMEPAYIFRVEDCEMYAVLVGMDQTTQHYIIGDCDLLLIFTDFVQFCPLMLVSHLYAMGFCTSSPELKQ